MQELGGQVYICFLSKNEGGIQIALEISLERDWSCVTDARARLVVGTVPV
jgi:hypothetical protein